MKKLATFLSVLSLLVVLSCSKSNDAAPAAAPSIVGTWKLDTYAITGCLNSDDNSGAQSCSISGCTTDTFGTDGSYTSSGGFTGTYTISGNMVTITYNIGGVGSVSVPYQFAVTSTTLTLTVDDDSSGANCKMVNSYTRM